MRKVLVTLQDQRGRPLVSKSLFVSVSFPSSRIRYEGQIFNFWKISPTDPNLPPDHSHVFIFRPEREPVDWANLE
jgi:hypothetical protein